MINQTNLTVTSIGTNGYRYWAKINGEKVTLTRSQYYSFLQLDTCQHILQNDMADAQSQMNTKIPMF